MVECADGKSFSDVLKSGQVTTNRAKKKTADLDPKPTNFEIQNPVSKGAMKNFC